MILTHVLRGFRDSDLYRVYGKSSKDTPTVLNVDADIAFLDSMAKFSTNYNIDDFMMVELCPMASSSSSAGPVRLLEDSVEKGAWVICTGLESSPASLNLLDFMIRRLMSNKQAHEDFRLWIICQAMSCISRPTAQRCLHHFLGDEFTDQDYALQREFHFK